ncbi:protein NO VEIN domain-containing protein [Kribbella sp. VKM Ac-2566]|uniref:protein NO VEIN domain-containing protein n=1 Tax=Kribbella sp. VKM Ac-2566 TaxID=2512218 RepID=UPI0010625352|nr:DUF3883 domain-containing protein [Kribbella sp. VKM Ac-2566]TDW98060.1 hypothetical protein EV647_2755 [Kribbella sp. VKM Ac-2566]
MKLVDDDGRHIDARLTVEQTARGDVEVVLDSAGGTGGSRQSRNREYPLALETLLRRFSLADASLLDVLVESRTAQSLPPEDRRVHPVPWTYPVRLNDVADYPRLRLALTRPQGNIASTARAGGGNERKRIRLTFAVPNGRDLDQIKALLQVTNLPSPTSEGLAPEVADAHLAADIGAGRPPRGQGFRQDVKARLAIEAHAVSVTTTFLRKLGYSVDNVGATQPFDLDARKDRDRLQVEVKGTTSSGSQVILTRGEVALHKAAYPNNALAIVHSIELDISAGEPTTVGGVLVWRSPWLVEEHALSPIAFDYVTGL